MLLIAGKAKTWVLHVSYMTLMNYQAPRHLSDSNAENCHQAFSYQQLRSIRELGQASRQDFGGYVPGEFRLGYVVTSRATHSVFFIPIEIKVFRSMNSVIYFRQT